MEETNDFNMTTISHDEITAFKYDDGSFNLALEVPYERYISVELEKKEIEELIERLKKLIE